MKRYLAAVAFFVAAGSGLLAVQENPVPVRTVQPVYPAQLRQERVSGVVMVKCSIDEQGNVSDTAVLKSTNELFDAPALEALKKWKFKPARQDGKPVAIQVTIPIKFVLHDS